VDLPGWVDVAIIVVCILLALAVIWMMFSRSRVTAESGDEVAERSPFDPMLMVSALAVIALAAAAYFLV
jgi:hypothetical protein